MTADERLFILQFLSDLRENNSRDWFQAHRADYERAKSTFHKMIAMTIERIGEFDPVIRAIEVKSTVYRINRDTRFSPDKSPYKVHLGSYINPLGTKSLHGGYYLHLEPGSCGVGSGPYWLPTEVLTAVRRDIVARTDAFRSIMEDPTFKANFQSFGMNHLKTLPKGFDKDYPYPEYLRPKDYTLWYDLSDNFLKSDDWLDVVADKFALMKPFMDFVNETIDDYC